jgi:hypothetical protein
MRDGILGATGGATRTSRAGQETRPTLLTFWRVLPVYFWVLAMAVRR